MIGLPLPEYAALTLGWLAIGVVAAVLGVRSLIGNGHPFGIHGFWAVVALVAGLCGLYLGIGGIVQYVRSRD